MRVITLSREFGSGGRELGKRLADYMGFAYYDKEILTAVAQQGNLDEGYVERLLENGPQRSFPITYGRTLSIRHQQDTTNLLVLQQKVLKTMAAKGDCVIVGRSADMILQDYRPFNLFVYADMESRLKRCLSYADSHEQMTEKELRAKIRQIDRQRSKYYELCTGRQWGAKENYHLCVNTSGLCIEEITPAIGEYIKIQFIRGEK